MSDALPQAPKQSSCGPCLAMSTSDRCARLWPSPRHQLQLVQLLQDGHPILVVLPCFLLWTATEAQEGHVNPVAPNFAVRDTLQFWRFVACRVLTFSASSDLNACLVASEICTDTHYRTLAGLGRSPTQQRQLTAELTSGTSGFRARLAMLSVVYLPRTERLQAV